MIRPPRGSCAFISRNASCVQRNAPVRLTSTTALPLLERQLVQRNRRRADAGVVEQQVQPAEALRATASNRASTPSSVGDIGRDRRGHSPPMRRDGARFLRAASSRRPASATHDPPARAPAAQARPMPLPAPVTRATRGVVMTACAPSGTPPPGAPARRYAPGRASRSAPRRRAAVRPVRRWWRPDGDVASRHQQGRGAAGPDEVAVGAEHEVVVPHVAAESGQGGRVQFRPSGAHFDAPVGMHLVEVIGLHRMQADGVLQHRWRRPAPARFRAACRQ